MLVQLRDGSSVVVRPVGPIDRPLVAAAFDHVTGDYEAIGAIDPLTGQGVGIARLLRNPARPGVAEAEVVVVDAWQGRDLERVLGNHLVRWARRKGIDVGADEYQRVASTAARASASYGLPA